KDFDTGVALLADVVARPTFPAKELERARLQAIAEVKSRYDDPGALAELHADYLLYGETDPYGDEPTARSLGSIRRDDLVEFHRKWIVPAGATLAVAGDVDASVFPKIEAAFAGWKPATQNATAAPTPTPAPAAGLAAARPGLRIVDKPDLTQSFIAVALPGPPRRTADYFALTALDAVVGNGFAARLTHIVRTQNGKTYDIEGSFRMRRRRGSYVVTTSTRTAETAATVALVTDELTALSRGTRPVTAAELAQAKRSLIGSWPGQFESADSWANVILSARLFGVDLADYTDHRRRVGDVPLADANDAARRWLDPSNAVIVVVGNAADVKEPLEAKYGKAEVVSFLTPTHAIDARATTSRAREREKKR
ncbi:MAG TPA: pitrilysin family protein, partial [bacterium]|nr:pitrilysin family protein [bacterium]